MGAYYYAICAQKMGSLFIQRDIKTDQLEIYESWVSAHKALMLTRPATHQEFDIIRIEVHKDNV